MGETRQVPPGTRGGSGPTAYLLGDLDMVAPLARAGIRCRLVTPPGDPARYTRRASVLGWADPAREPEELLDLLLEHAADEPEIPVLFFQSDAATLFVGRYRDRLAPHLRFVVAEQELLEVLVDKLRFRELAERLDLPVPPSRRFDAATDPVPDDVLFPALVKPSHRDARWVQLEPAGKAVRVPDRAALEALRPRLAAFGRPVLLQTVVEGPESSIESYHCYITAAGEVAGEFTGRKVRTRPVEFGRTTAAVITDVDDVRTVGRRVCERLGLRGVAKVDLKRDADGRLWLLEVNPRCTLWLNPGALAGVDLPALVWADLSGRPRPPARPVRAGVRWCSSWDLQAARQWGVPTAQWLRWAASCETRSMLDVRDPLPALRLGLVRGRRVLRRRG